jgi:hypothetical protein
MNLESTEKQIRDLLASETNYWTLTDKLFGPTGHFGQMGATVEERKVIGRSPLFREAQKRVRDMEYAIAERLQREMKNRPVRFERTKSV